MAESMPRPIRFGDELWARFGVACAITPLDRSATVRDMIRLYLELGPDLWVRFSSAAGEDRADVLRAFMAWYLGAPEAELPSHRPA